MNSQIAKKRIGDVIRVDTITSNQSDFMATHVEIKNIQLSKSYAGRPEKIVTEEDALNQYVLNPSNRHQLILVIGLNGTGKSHLIRWFATKLSRFCPENEVVLFIRRSDNSLRGTIKQLLELEEVAHIPNKEVYDRLVRASTIIDDKKLKDMIYQNFIVEILNDDNDEILTHHKKKRLVSLLQNDSFKARLLEDDKAIDRIYQKVAYSKSSDNRDTVALFDMADFQVDGEFCVKLECDEADKNARIMANNLSGDDELAHQVAKYMNTLVNSVIQTCAGLEPGDFEQVFLEIRKELKRQGKALTLLIEDITAFTGVNVALLNVLSWENTGLYKDLCRISSVIGITTAYFETVFPSNYQERVTDYMRISDAAFGSDSDSLYEFVGRYLNAMSLPSGVLENWLDNDAQVSDYPVHDSVEGRNWESFVLRDGKPLNLFPFTKKAIIKLFTLLPEHQQTPRYLLRDIVERGVRNYLAGPECFPSFTIDRSENYPWNPIEHRSRLMQFVKDTEFNRMDIFIRIWGDANLFMVTDKAGIKYLGGIPESAFSEFKMAEIQGIDRSFTDTGDIPDERGKDDQTSPTAQPAEVNLPNRQEKPKKEVNPAQIAYQMGIQIIYKWIQGGSLVFDSTKKDAKMMQQARDEMNRYIYNAVNWQIEGVSLDNISKFTSKRFIEFERQSKDVGKALITLPASQETQNVLEAFVAFVTLGGGQSWNFEGAVWQQFQVQCWFEKIKPDIIKGVKFFNGVEVDYQECALSAEMLREILFGQYKGTNVDSMQEKLLWESSVEKIPANTAHCKEWVSLMQGTNENAQRIKDTIFSYYNIVQGTGGKNKYLYYTRLVSDFQKVQKRRLHIDESILSEKDSFRLRDEIRNIFRDIQGKLQVVSRAEVALAQDKLDKLGLLIDYADIEDEDILEIVDKITKFYDATSSAQVNVTYDTAMINAVRRDAEPIANAIKKVAEAVKLTDSLDILMAFSQDPLIRVNKLLELLTKAKNDIKFVQRDVEKRREKLVQKSSQTEGSYAKQKEVIEDNREIIKGWEV